jgi:hypothetical protein
LSLKHFPYLDLETRLADDVKIFVESSIEYGPLKRYNTATKDLIVKKLLGLKERYIYAFSLCHPPIFIGY